MVREMNFHRYVSAYEGDKREYTDAKLQCDDFYGALVCLATKDGRRDTAISALVQWSWYGEERPYYLVWPSIVPALLRVNLDKMNGEHVRLPVAALLLQFAVGHEPALGNNEFRLATILLNQREDTLDFLCTTIDGSGLIFTITLRPRVSVEHLLFDEKINATDLSDDVFRDIVRMVCTICLLSEDPDLLEPDVLAKDRVAYQQTRDTKYVEKAVRRRGTRGWHVGKGFHQKMERGELSPHARCPHFSTRWTGAGRQVPTLVLIAATIVNRNKITEVPTGYLDRIA
jgi:hypothetical protein